MRRWTFSTAHRQPSLVTGLGGHDPLISATTIPREPLKTTGLCVCIAGPVAFDLCRGGVAAVLFSSHLGFRALAVGLEGLGLRV